MIVAGVVVARLSADRLAKLGYGNVVKCGACGQTETVDPFHCFRTGWPEHCGKTMELQKKEPTP